MDANDELSEGGTVLLQSIGKVRAIGFWSLFVVAVILHLWIGGVVVDYKIEGNQHLMKLRNQSGEWTSVNVAVFWAHLIVKYSMLAVGVLAAAWMLWRWSCRLRQPK